MLSVWGSSIRVWVLGFSFQGSNLGLGAQGFPFKVQDSGVEVSDFGFAHLVKSLEDEILDEHSNLLHVYLVKPASACGVSGSGFRLWGLGVRVSCLGFRVLGSGFGGQRRGVLGHELSARLCLCVNAQLAPPPSDQLRAIEVIQRVPPQRIVHGGSCSRFEGLKLRVWGLGFGVWDLGIEVWCLRFGVWGLRFEV